MSAWLLRGKVFSLLLYLSSPFSSRGLPKPPFPLHHTLWRTLKEEKVSQEEVEEEGGGAESVRLGRRKEIAFA
jgi:hypothetical protein